MGSLWQNPIPLPPGTDSACSLSTQLTVALGKASLTPAWDDSPLDLPLSSLFLKSNNKGDRKEEQHEHRGQNGCWSKDAGAHGWNTEYILGNGTHKALRHPQGQLALKPTKILGKDFTQLGKVIRFAFYKFISASAMSPWLPSRTTSAFSLNINPFLEPTTWPSSLLTMPHLLLQDQLAAHVVIITDNCVCSASGRKIVLWGRWGPEVLWLFRSHRVTHWVSFKKAINELLQIKTNDRQILLNLKEFLENINSA